MSTIDDHTHPATPVVDEPGLAYAAPPDVVAYVCERLDAGRPLLDVLGTAFVVERTQGDPAALDALARDPEVRNHAFRARPLLLGTGLPTRVVVAEDHPLYRRAVVRAVEEAHGEVVGEAGDGREALELIERERPTLAVLDMRMPELSGLEVCREVAARRPGLETRVLLLSAYSDPDLVWNTVAAGAAGYIDKEASPNEIQAAIKRVAAGGIAFTERTRRGVNRGFATLYE